MSHLVHLARELGYRELGRFLPAVRLDEDSSDFSYQINRPRRSTVIPELSVNRLSKWSVGKFQAFVASETGIAVSEPRFHMSSGDRYQFEP